MQKNNKLNLVCILSYCTSQIQTNDKEKKNKEDLFSFQKQYRKKRKIKKEQVRLIKKNLLKKKNYKFRIFSF